MKQITIFKNGIATHGPATFESDEKLQAWFEKHKAMGTFGRNAITEKQTVVVKQAEYEPGELVLVQEAVLDEQGNEIEPARYEAQDVLVSPEVTEEIEVEIEPAEYTVVIEDLTAHLEQERINKEASDFLAATDWKVIRHRDQQELGLATSLTIQEFQDLLRERQMARESIIKV